MAEHIVSRREFLRETAQTSVALAVGASLIDGELLAASAAAPFSPAAWISIDGNGIVSVRVDKVELGQGVNTMIPMVVAEELEADWTKIRWLPITEDPSKWVRGISTGGSTSTRTSWQPLRKAAAAAREMLRTAAAQQWGVAATECKAEQGFIRHEASKRRAAYGSLVEAAAKLPLPSDAPLKPSSQFTLVGHSTPRFDIPEKVDGRAIFGMDVALPGMVVAAVARPPAFGALVRSVDESKARAIPGVLDIVRIPQGVAVIAKNTWAVFSGKAALVIDWDSSPALGLSSDELFTKFAALAQSPGQVARSAGDLPAALSAAAHVVEAEYRLPFIDHMVLEPMNAVARAKNGTVEVWVPTQIPTGAQQAAARVAGVPVGNVVMHVPYVGGGFGRRLNADDTVIAVEIAKRYDAPVHYVATREETVRNGYYRPLTYHKLKGGVDKDGKLTAWQHSIVGAAERGLVVGGIESPPYDIPNFSADFQLQPSAVPTGAWRSVTYTHNGFVIESFIDELAHAAGVDPYEFRRRHMSNPKLHAALDLVAEKANWGKPAAGRYQGIAAVSSFGSHAAEVAEISVDEKGRIKVHRVVVAVHVGLVVNPDNLLQQVEGAITLALSYTLKHEITVKDGVVQQNNFTQYPILRLEEMPVIELHTVPSDDAPTGIGEPPVPPLAAAVANALFAATGKRVRKLPIRADDLKV